MKVYHSVDWSFHYLNMKLSGFFKKGVFASRNARVIFVTVLAVGNILTMASLSLAWFLQYSATSSQMKTFSGDLDISIEKVCAYKYVYPYHNNSPEFINYDGNGVVKSYVVEDSTVEAPSNLSSYSTFTLGVNENQSRTTSANAGTASAIHYDDSQSLRYFLVGNEVFNGVTNNPWSTLTSSPFTSTDDPEESETPNDSKSIILKDVMVSAGAEFMFFDANTVGTDPEHNNDPICSYFTYSDPVVEAGKNSRFSVVSGHLKCLKSGVYDFRYRLDDSGHYYLDITLTASGDSTIMASNLVDLTKISIDYYGGALDLEDLGVNSIEDYLPFGIQDQKTMVLLDILVKYQNKNDIEAGLKIVRAEEAVEPSINTFDGKYNTDDDYTFLGYKNDSERNPLLASDFYAFYPELLSAAHVAQNGYDNPSTVWNAFNNHTTNYTVNDVPQYSKFDNSSDYKSDLDCTIHGDSTLIPGSANAQYYHIFIAVDYDYEYMNFFLNKDRLGVTYILDRDFSFYFTATQVTVEESSSSQMSTSTSEGGESE